MSEKRTTNHRTEISLQQTQSLINEDCEDGERIVKEPLLQDTGAESTEKKKQSFIVKFLTFSVLFSLIKLSITIIISLTNDSYWKACSNPPDHRNYFCQAHGLSMECSTLDNDCYVGNYSPVGSQCSTKCFFGGEMLVGRDDTADGGCYGYIDSTCLCNLWLNTKLVVICLSIAHFLLQLWYLYEGHVFDPQATALDIMLHSKNNFYLQLCHPSNCFISVIEMATVVMAWFSIVYAPSGNTDVTSWITCSDSTIVTIDTYYALLLYPIQVTLLEITKLNIRGFCTYQNEYNAIKTKNMNVFRKYAHYFVSKCFAVSYFFRIDLLFTFLVLLLVQTFSFVFLSLVCLVCYRDQWKGYSDLQARWEEYIEFHHKTYLEESYQRHWRWAIGSIVFLVLILVVIPLSVAFSYK